MPRNPPHSGRRRLFLLSLCGFAVFAWVQRSGFQTIVELRNSWRMEQAMAHDIERLKQDNAALEEEIHELETNGESIARIARQKLGWAEEGEIVIKIPEKK